MRCGGRPRAEGLYVCYDCHSDPRMANEMGLARAKYPFSVADQKFWLVGELDWHGHWGIRGA